MSILQSMNGNSHSLGQPTSPTSVSSVSDFSEHIIVSVWNILRSQAIDIIEREPLLEATIHHAILQHQSFGEALIYRLAKKLGGRVFTSDLYLKLFREALTTCDNSVEKLAMQDLIAIEERDPACKTIAQAFLYFKGYKAIQAYR